MSPTKKISKLTTAQESLLTERYQEWLAVGRNCQPLDMAEATAVIAEFYRHIGKPAPVVLKLSSPAMCLLAWAALSQLRSQLDSQLWGQLRSQLGSQLDGYFAGQHWCAWEVFYRFCEEIGVCYSPEQSELVGLWLWQSRALHWWFPYDGIVLISERHHVLRNDEQGRLHSADGPACAYPDGWGIWAWHGVCVPQLVIEKPQSITVAEIHKEENAEVRRVMIERYGQSRYLVDSGAKLIHRDEMGELYRTELPDDEPLVMVKVLNSTPEADGNRKPYFLRVNPELRPLLAGGKLGERQPLTARAAVASTFGMTADEYAKHLAAES